MFSLIEVPTAGKTYTLNCVATVVKGLVVQPDLTIMDPNSTVVSMNNVSSVTYTFSLLRTSDGGQYKCTASVNIPQAEIEGLQSFAVMTITVAGEKAILYCLLPLLS